MLTKTFERDTVRQNLDTKNDSSNNNQNKCAQYWPEKVNETQKTDNGIVIKHKSEEVHYSYTKRKLLITKVSSLNTKAMGSQKIG